ncbi:MAG: hypothetical protein AB1725_04295 [Armatimonadota bacterium]
MKRRVLRACLGVVGVVAILFVAVILFRGRETLDEAQARVIEALRQEDAATLLRYAPREEVELLDLNQEKVRGLLRAAWSTRAGDAQPVGRPKITRYPATEALASAQTWRRGDGSEFVVGILLAETDEGITLSALTDTILLNSLLSVWDTRKGQLTGSAKVSLIAEELHDSMGSLASSGLDAVVRARGSEMSLERVTWEEYLGKLRDLADEAARRESAARGPG